MMCAMKILLVEDEPAVQAAVARALRLEGDEVDCAATLAAARTAMDSDPDVVLLDRNLPDGDGLELCRALRGEGDRTPVLVLTARDQVADRVEGLDAGADDYLVKPFALDELLARVRALGRRTGATDILRFADIEVDARKRLATRGGRDLDLTKTEFALLELLLRTPGEVLDRSRIFTEVWGFDFGPTSNSLNVYIGYLRRKLEAAGEPRVVQTVAGVGYVLRETP